MSIRAYNRGSRLLADEAIRTIDASRCTQEARAQLWRDLLTRGCILHFEAAGGAVVTAGPHIVAVGPSFFSVYRDHGDARWRGSHIGTAWGCALFIIENVGRRRPFKVSA